MNEFLRDWFHKEHIRGFIAVTLLSFLILGLWFLKAATGETTTFGPAFNLLSMIALATLTVGVTIGFIVGNTDEKSNIQVVADWITKLLIGAGLAQIRQVRASFWDITTTIATSIEAALPQSSKPAIPLAYIETEVAGTLIYFVFFGLLGGIVIARIYVNQASKLVESQPKLQSILHTRELPT